MRNGGRGVHRQSIARDRVEDVDAFGLTHGHEGETRSGIFNIRKWPAAGGQYCHNTADRHPKSDCSAGTGAERYIDRSTTTVRRNFSCELQSCWRGDGGQRHGKVLLQATVPTTILCFQSNSSKYGTGLTIKKGGSGSKKTGDTRHERPHLQPTRRFLRRL